MRRFLFLTATLWLMTQAASATEVVVRSGEHVGFTRIALDLPGPLQWELLETEGAADLTFNTRELTFDTTSTFERISKSRLSGISVKPNSNTLHLDLNCKCKIEAFLASGNMLVLDIADKMVSEVSASSRKKSDSPIPRAHHLGFSTARSPDSPLFQIGKKDNFHLGLGIALDTQEKSPAAVQREIDTDVGRIQSVKSAEQRLITQIARAATQGLLSVQGPQIGLSPKQVIHQAPIPQTAPSSTPREASPARFENVNLRAQSSIDQGQSQSEGEVPQTINGGSCLVEFDLEIQHWGNNTAFGEQIGAFRTKLTKEFDHTNKEATLGLMKLYLHFGFGAEAAQLLEVSDPESAYSNILGSMARILENGSDPQPSPFSSLSECDSVVALWSVLSSSSPMPSSKMNIPATLRALNSLPIYLRSHLGPILSERMMLAGETEAARSILRILDRSAKHPDPSTHMAKATLELAEENFEAAAHSLDAVISADTKMSPKALVQLFETLIATEKPIPPHLADLAGAYALEKRDDPLGNELRRVQILALANTAHFRLAMIEMTRVKTNFRQLEYDKLRSAVLNVLTENADEITFLEHILPQSKQTPENLEFSTTDQVARRLIDLGFTKLARRFLTQGNEQPEAIEHRLLLAQLALSEKKPRLAEAEIVGLTGNNAETIRAESRSMLGDHSSAQELYTSITEPYSSAAEAWLAGDWALLVGSDNPEIAAAAQLMHNQNNDQIDELSIENSIESITKKHGVLAQTRDLLDDSNSTRETITALLEAMAVGQ